MLLAIDTATQYAGIALYTGEEVLLEMTWRAGRHHTRQVPPAIDEAFRRTGTAPTDLTGVAVALGPGSFTGLRIGLSLAKGFAVACDIPIVGVPTLDVTARPHFHGSTPLCAVLQAGRGRLAFAFYAPDESGTWQRQGDYRLGSPEDVAALVAEPTRFVGEVTARERERWRARLADLARFLTPALNVRRPGVLAELAWERLQAGDTDDPATLAPIYLHVPGS